MITNQTIDGVPRDLSVSISLTKQQERDILRFYDTCEDGQGYDVPKDRMKSLACLGLIRPTGFSRYELTDAGDAVIEKLRALLDVSLADKGDIPAAHPQGVPPELREALQHLIDNHVDADGAGEVIVQREDFDELRALLDAPGIEVRDKCGVQMVDCPECSHQWDHCFECGNGPANPKPTGLSQGWNLTRKHDGFVVGHQSVAYPPDEKAIERAERDGYVWVPFLVPAAQPQSGGEPVALEEQVSLIAQVVQPVMLMLEDLAHKRWPDKDHDLTGHYVSANINHAASAAKFHIPHLKAALVQLNELLEFSAEQPASVEDDAKAQPVGAAPDLSQHQGSPVDLSLQGMLNLNWSAADVVRAISDQGPLYRKPPVSDGDTASLRKVYDLIGLSYSQPVSVLLANLKNIIRFSNLLHAIERNFMMVPGKPSDEPEDEGCEPDDLCLVNCWGSSEAEYIEQFRAALSTLTEMRSTELAKYIAVVDGCYRLASMHSGSIDGVDELGGDEHADPICAIFHRLYYARYLLPKTVSDGDAFVESRHG
ncbi:MAG: hypothetical protein WBI95_23560 [Pseudomonas veronii]|uniref:Uncharacterized protein n=1 Tax=Pseudomonas veronii TaxID=76761 RepID=A0A7Y1AB42_PSEVE|nr:hypothetical protein [Pseudomonas veronii]NMY12542.1 hypothetical protein [Pseudomonas veronii]